MKTISTTIDIDADATAIWNVLTDFPSHADWDPFFFSVAGEPSVGASLSIRARKPDGSAGMGFTPTVLEVEPARLLRWKGKLLFGGLFDGEHCFELIPIDGGATRLLHGEHFSGMLIPLMGKLLADTEAGFHAFNQALAAEVAARGSSAVRA